MFLNDNVLSEFGQGDVLPAREAVRAGMADLVGGMKDALALISPPQPKPKGVVMTKQTETPETPPETQVIWSQFLDHGGLYCQKSS